MADRQQKKMADKGISNMVGKDNLKLKGIVLEVKRNFIVIKSNLWSTEWRKISGQ